MAMDLEGLACLVEKQIQNPSLVERDRNLNSLSRLVDLEVSRDCNLCQLPTSLLLSLIEQGYDPIQSEDIYLKLQRVIRDLKRGTRVRYDLFQFDTLQEEYKHNCDFELRKIRSNYAVQMVDKLLKLFFENDLSTQACYYRQIVRATCHEDSGEFAQYWIHNFPMLLYFKSHLVQAVELRTRLLELPLELLQREFINKSFDTLTPTNIDRYRIDEFIWESLLRAEFWNSLYDWPYWRSHFIEASRRPNQYRQHQPNVMRKRQRGGAASRPVFARPPRRALAPTPIDEGAEQFVADLLNVSNLP